MLLSISYPASGASYCDVGYDTTCPHPTIEDPLGVKFPGMTYATRPGDDEEQPNWVGHLVSSRDPRHPLLVYCLAVGGAQATDVQRQILKSFIPSIGARPDWAPWNAHDTLFSK